MNKTYGLYGMNIPDTALCGISNAILCDYGVIRDVPEALIERCRFCGKRQTYRRHRQTGRMDNTAYAQAHLRNFLQPWPPMNKLYIKIYGYEHYLKAKKREADSRAVPKIEEIQAEARDMYKTLGRKSTHFG